MSDTLEFYFDFGSPTAYLAHKRLQQLRDKGIVAEYVPVLLGGIFKATGNASPVTIPAKGKYMLEQDLPRFASHYGVPLNFNPYFPINTLQLMRGVIAARHLECADSFIDAAFNGVWVEQKDMGNPEVVATTLSDAGLDADKLMSMAQETEIKTELIANTEAAVERGLFGVPTLFLGDQMYFGQDRFEFIEKALAGATTTRP